MMNKRMMIATVIVISFVAASLAWVIAQDEPNADAERASALMDMLNAQAYPYTWHYEPGVEPGFYQGQVPHGVVLRSYANNIAVNALAAEANPLPPGAMFVKENYSDERELMAITFMLKLEQGINPDAGDWFYAKIQPDGTVEAAGAPAGCVGCHTQVKDDDWLFKGRQLPLE